MISVDFHVVPVVVSALLLFHLHCRGAAADSRCPSSAYTYCVSEKNQCHIPATLSSGYISYGANERFVLHPFTNSNPQGTAARLWCGNELGDLTSGVTKHCCYVAADHGWDSEPWTNLHDKETCFKYVSWAAPSQIEGIRLGVNGIYIYRACQGDHGPLICRQDLGDIVVNSDKFPQQRAGRTSRGVAALQHIDSWVPCAQEGQTCAGLDATVATWVRYGDGEDDEQWRFRLVASAEVPCTNTVFGDPDKRHTKFCYRSDPVVEFAKVEGYWHPVIICGGGCSSSYTMKTGVTRHEESALSNEFAWSLEASASASYGFGETSLTTSVAESVVSSSLSSVTQTVEVEMSVSCSDTSDQALWQFRTRATEKNLVSGMLDFEIGSLNMWCVSDDGLKPQCPPGFCEGDDCQECSEPISRSVSVAISRAVLRNTTDETEACATAAEA